jgi:hypothetical protein
MDFSIIIFFGVTLLIFGGTILHELEKMEFETQQDSWLFRRDYKHELWKEYRDRLDFIEHRVIELGGNNGVHKIEEYGQ